LLEEAPDPLLDVRNKDPEAVVDGWNPWSPLPNK
jgi:hypothetical protein